MDRHRIAILTSSRADYGIYKPLLSALQQEEQYEVQIIAFGTHLSRFHGYTLQAIEQDGFTVAHTIETMLLTDSPNAIASAMGLTMLKFATLWEQVRGKIDLVFALGDRYEMAAAVLSAVPFQLPIAHLHAGETTLGATDNIFRHSISLAAHYHFTATQRSWQKTRELLGEAAQHVYQVGALSLDNLQQQTLLDKQAFCMKYGIQTDKPFILTTFHPETVAFAQNEIYIQELTKALQSLLPLYQIVITMPNTDTASSMIRQAWTKWAAGNSDIVIIENFGTIGYFSAMRHCAFLLGNTSSGIIEAASLGKYVINIGDRQKGREAGNNVLHTPIVAESIVNAVQQLNTLPPLTNENIYGDGQTAQKIIRILKEKIFTKNL
jgi:GDP/UDP-N,N'-diacetylbacillosamine 2-epimerase (hydrolysing)